MYSSMQIRLVIHLDLPPNSFLDYYYCHSRVIPIQTLPIVVIMTVLFCHWMKQLAQVSLLLFIIYHFILSSSSLLLLSSLMSLMLLFWLSLSYSVLGWTGRKGLITLDQLANMVSGLDVSYGCTFPFEAQLQQWESNSDTSTSFLEQCVQEIYERDLLSTPGTVFRYGATYVLFLYLFLPSIIVIIIN